MNYPQTHTISIMKTILESMDVKYIIENKKI